MLGSLPSPLPLPRTHRELFTETAQDFVSFLIARGISIAGFYVAFARATNSNKYNLEVAARYNLFVSIANAIRLFLSYIVNATTDASLLEDPEQSREQISQLYRITLTATVLPTVLTVLIIEAYVLSLRAVWGASEEAYEELLYLPLIYFVQQWLLMLMIAQANFVIGWNQPSTHKAIMATFVSGAVVMVASTYFLLQDTDRIETLIHANILQMLTVNILTTLYFLFPSRRFVFNKLFTSGWWDSLRYKAWDIQKKGWQPVVISSSKVISQLLMFPVLDSEALKAFQVLYSLANMIESISGIFEARTIVHIRTALKKLDPLPRELGSELRKIILYLVGMVSLLPLTLGVISLATPAFLNLFMPSEDQAFIDSALDHGKSLAPFVVGILAVLNSIGRGAIYATNKSTETYHKRINWLSTLANFTSAGLFPGLTALLKFAITDQVACAWLGLILSQLFGAVVQMGLAFDFTRHETKVRLAGPIAAETADDGNLGCLGFFKGPSRYIRLQSMRSSRRDEVEMTEPSITQEAP